MKKKCLNCLCMVDNTAKVCNFCKTPFKDEKLLPAPAVKTNFSPPVISNQEVSKPVFKQIDIAASLTPPEIIEAVPVETELEKELKLEGSYLATNEVIDNQEDILKEETVVFEALKNEKERKMLERVYEKISTNNDTYDANLDALGFVEEELDFKELKRRVPQSYIEPVENAKTTNNPNSGTMFGIPEKKSNKPESNIAEVSFLEIDEKKEEVPVPVEVKKIAKEIKKLDIKTIAKKISDRLSAEDPFLRDPFEIDSIEIAEIKDELPVEKEANAKATGINIKDTDMIKELNDLAMLMSPVQEVGAVEEVKKKESKKGNRFDTKDVIRVSNETIVEQSSPAPPVKNIRDAVSALESLQSELNENSVIQEITEEQNLIKEQIINEDFFSLADLENFSKEITDDKVLSAMESFANPDINDEQGDNEADNTEIYLSMEPLNNSEKSFENEPENTLLEKDELVVEKEKTDLSIGTVDLAQLVLDMQSENKLPQIETISEELPKVFSNRLKKFTKHDIEPVIEEEKITDSSELNLSEPEQKTENIELDLGLALEVFIPPMIEDLFQDEPDESKEEPEIKNIVSNRLKNLSKKIIEEDINTDNSNINETNVFIPIETKSTDEKKTLDKDNIETKDEVESPLIQEIKETIISEPELIKTENPENLSGKNDIEDNKIQEKIEEIQPVNQNSNLPVRIENYAENMISGLKNEEKEKILEKNALQTNTDVFNTLKSNSETQSHIINKKAIPNKPSQPHTNHVGARSTTSETAMRHYNDAKDYCVKRDYEKALEELEKSVVIDPAFEQAHILLSRTYLKLKNRY